MGLKPIEPRDDTPAEKRRYEADLADKIANPSAWACGPEHRPEIIVNRTVVTEQVALPSDLRKQVQK